jgi:hypothetical protein
MLHVRSQPAFCLSVLAFVAGSTGGVRAADPVIASTPAANIVVDGSLSEWDTLKPVAPGLQLGVANDGRSVYVAVLASDEQTRVSVLRGIVLWLDASGGHGETVGLQLPALPRIDPAAAGPSATGNVRLTPTISDRIDVLGPGKLERRLVDLTPSSDVAVATGGEDGGIAFEIRIPLNGSDAHALGLATSAGRAFALGIATPVPGKEREPPEPMYWIDPWAGVRIRGLGGPEVPTAPLPDSSNRPEKVIKPKPFKIWVSIQLAKAS